MFNWSFSGCQCFLLSIYRRYSTMAWLSLAILVLAGIITYTFVLSNPQLADNIYEMISAAMPKVESNENLFWVIFKRNLSAAGILIILGIFSLGLGTIVALMINGALIGGLLAFSQINGQIVWKLFLVGMMPHGIVEIPVIALASGVGLNLARVMFKKLFGTLESSIQENINWAIGCYFKAVLPGLLLAAVIEANVTPYLINKFLV